MKITSKQYAHALFASLSDKNAEDQGEVLDKFIQTLTSNNHGSRLEEILKYFNLFWDKKEGIVKAEVVSANKLDPETREQVKEVIFKKTAARNVKIKERTDKRVKGGIILKYNDCLIDLSLKTKLNKFKDNLIN